MYTKGEGRNQLSAKYNYLPEQPVHLAWSFRCFSRQEQDYGIAYLHSTA